MGHFPNTRLLLSTELSTNQVAFQLHSNSRFVAGPVLPSMCNQCITTAASQKKNENVIDGSRITTIQIVFAELKSLLVHR